jgi:hypothetical protein
MLMHGAGPSNAHEPWGQPQLKFRTFGCTHERPPVLVEGNSALSGNNPNTG